jgi:histidine kinase-, DNA gyrase B-, and HSP90-like ATPase
MNTIYWLVEYGSTLLECFLCSIFCGTFIEDTDLKKNFQRRLIISAVMSVIMLFINNIELYSPVTVVVGVALLGLTQFMIYFKHPIKSPILCVTFLLVIAVIDNIVVGIISYTLQMPTAEIYQKMSLYRVLAIISSKFILMLVTVSISKFFSQKIVIKRKYIIPLSGIIAIMFIITISITFIDIKKQKCKHSDFYSFFAIMMILLMIIFFGAFKLAEYYESQQHLKLIMLKNQMLEQSMSETEETFMLWKTSLHDFKHKIMNLMTLADNNDIQGIKQYLANENELLSKKLFYYKTGNDTVDTILNIKQKIAEKMGSLLLLMRRFLKTAIFPLRILHQYSEIYLTMQLKRQQMKMFHLLRLA